MQLEWAVVSYHLELCVCCEPLVKEVELTMDEILGACGNRATFLGMETGRA